MFLKVSQISQEGTYDEVSFFFKVTGQKVESPAQVFSINFSKFFKNTCFDRTLLVATS